jgi:hypothetical protein
VFAADELPGDPTRRKFYLCRRTHTLPGLQPAGSFIWAGELIRCQIRSAEARDNPRSLQGTSGRILSGYAFDFGQRQPTVSSRYVRPKPETTRGLSGNIPTKEYVRPKPETTRGLSGNIPTKEYIPPVRARDNLFSLHFVDQSTLKVTELTLRCPGTVV